MSQGLYTKDSIKRDYKLTLKTRYEVWEDSLQSELKAKDFRDVINKTITKMRELIKAEAEICQGLV